MTKYLLLGTFDKPEDDVRDLLANGHRIEALLKKLKIEKMQGWPSMGAYDYVVLCDVDNDIQIQNTVLFAKKTFGQRTTIIRLFDENEILGFLPLEDTPTR